MPGAFFLKVIFAGFSKVPIKKILPGAFSSKQIPSLVKISGIHTVTIKKLDVQLTSSEQGVETVEDYKSRADSCSFDRGQKGCFVCL